MGLKCSFLGHAYEEAGVEREREEQGSEVVTVVKELERCSRCGRERVVSESTEVTTVVDPSDVDADVDAADAGGGAGSASGFGGAVERAMQEGGDADGAETLDDGAAEGADDGAGGPPADTASGHAGGRAGGGADGRAGGDVDDHADAADDSFEPRDPEEEDAEILTDDDERAPGEWPDEGDGDSGHADAPENSDPATESAPAAEPDPVTDRSPDVKSDHAVVESGDGEFEFDDAGSESAPVEGESSDAGDGPATDRPDEESLSGITVPEGRIECPECNFEVDADTSYRDGDPCPRCNAWLTTVEE